jgi:hypothetical protein
LLTDLKIRTRTNNINSDFGFCLKSNGFGRLAQEVVTLASTLP